MRRQIINVIDILGKTFPDARPRRFDLRYINSIEIADLSAPLSWRDYINPKLLETITFFTDQKKSNSSYSDYRTEVWSSNGEISIRDA